MKDSNYQVQPGPENVSSALALANAAAVAAGVVRGLASKDVGDTINGSPLMQDQLANMVCARITRNLQNKHIEARSMRLQGYM